MSVSRRHAIHWPESQPADGESEPASTVVVTSPGGFFVDVRCREVQETHLYPEWFFAGNEVTSADNDSVIAFNHAFFDSQYVATPTAVIPADIGTFSDPENEAERAVGIRVESGTMVNPQTGVLERYVEKWITAHPYSRDLHWIGDDIINARSVVLLAGSADKMRDVLPGEYSELLVSYGNWRQGVFWRRNDSVKVESSVGVVRAYENNVFVQHGEYAMAFPSWERICNVTRPGETITVGEDLVWQVIEYSP